MRSEIDYSEMEINKGEEGIQMRRLHALWAAVLAAAVMDYWGGQLSRPAANRWLQSRNTGLGSFEFVCSILDLDPSEARIHITSSEGRASITLNKRRQATARARAASKETKQRVARENHAAQQNA